MRVDLSREFHVPLKAAYDYLSDWTAFTDWRVGMVEVLNPDTAAWSKPGDGFRFSYRLLGRLIEGESVIDEIREQEIDRFTSTVPGLGTVTETWLYKPIDEESFALTVIQEGPEPTNFFGKIIDRTLLPRVIQRDLERTLDNLEDIFSMGIPD
jgi:hypothetical protein